MTRKKTKMPPCGRSLPDQPRSLSDAKAVYAAMKHKLESHVAAKKLKRSEARSKILNVIIGERLHFTAQDLVDRLRADHPEVGRSTLYRNLPIFIESGLIQEGPTDPKGEILYELSGGAHHDHIVCLDCRSIFEFHDASIEEKQTRLSKKRGFTAQDHRHVIYASCDLLKRPSR
jgi:Fur family ferric uptake transcriptional regulator